MLSEQRIANLDMELTDMRRSGRSCLLLTTVSTFSHTSAGLPAGGLAGEATLLVAC